MKQETKEMLKTCGFGVQVERGERGCCPLCEKKINMDEFRDELSRKEYEISAMCQKCQDSVFGGGNES